MTWNWQQQDWPNWQYDPNALQKKEQRFLLQSGQLLGAWRHLTQDDKDTVTVELLSTEAMKTSEIEGEYLDRASVQSSIKKQFGMQAPDRSGKAEAGIAALMHILFTSYAEPLSHDTLHHWHELICGTQTDIQTIGGYRTHAEAMQVVSGPIQKRVVHFEAPPSDRVQAEMDAFIAWFNDSSMPALAKAALAHLWFVSIHPYEDGNGRIARALSEKALAQSLEQPSLLALAKTIEKHRAAYYDQLAVNNQTMTVDGWFAWFADAALEAQTYSQSLIEHIIVKTRMLDDLGGQINDRQRKALIRMFDAGPEGFEGGLSAKNYITITDTTTATATRDLRDLVAKGALRRTGEQKWTRYWLAI